VRVAVKRFDLSGVDEDSWDFLCECGVDDCREWVTLRAAEYEAMRRMDEPILASGHMLKRAKRVLKRTQPG